MFFPKKMVGIDIGTSAIKIVEISRWGQGKTLENYGEIKSEFISKEPLLNAKKSNSLVSNTLTAKAIKAILKCDHPQGVEGDYIGSVIFFAELFSFGKSDTINE